MGEAVARTEVPFEAGAREERVPVRMAGYDSRTVVELYLGPRGLCWDTANQ